MTSYDRVAATSAPGYCPRAMAPHASLRFRAVRAASSWLAALSLAVIMPAIVGCQKPKAPSEKKEMKAEAPKPAEKKPVMAKTSDPECIGDWSTTGDPKTVKVGERTFEIRGAQLTQTSKDADAKITLGVMANIKEDTPDNLSNIKSILEFFKTEGVEAIVVAGDLGESESQIANVLKPIAQTQLPVFITIGNRERKVDFNKAAEATAKEFPGVVNLNFVRLANLDDVSLVSVPGYYDKSYIHVKDGCHYQSSDLGMLGDAVKAAGGQPVVLVSHGPPRQSGTEAIDRTQEQANVGDPALTQALTDAGIKFGIFAQIQEAGGRATDPTGTKLIGPGTTADALFLNPGATDSVSWPMNDGTRSVGMAAVMTIDGGKATYKVHRIPEKG